MKLIEIFDSPSRDEYNDNYIHYFINAPTITTIPGTNYVLKISTNDQSDTKYGIFDPLHNNLISYLSISVNNGVAIVGLPSTDPEYRKQGLMSFLYSYIVLKDGYQLLSDDRQTPEAKHLWLSCKRNHFFNIDVIDIQTGKRHPWKGDNEPWESQTDNIRLIAYRFTNEQYTLSEQYTCRYGSRADRRRLAMDNPELYGTNSYKMYTNPEDIAP